MSGRRSSSLPPKPFHIETMVSTRLFLAWFSTSCQTFDIHPRHLVYWICVKSDAERDRMAWNPELMTGPRDVLVTSDYPPEGRDHVYIGFESQETVDRESAGNWWHHWK
jgi:hypothetical protein